MKNNSIAILLATAMLCMVLVTMVARWQGKVDKRLQARGVANAAFMAETYKMDFDPETAQHYQVVITTTDVSFSGAQITNFFDKD